jgi:hypothetical protein
MISLWISLWISLDLPPEAACFGHLYDPEGALARGLLPRNGEHVG